MEIVYAKGEAGYRCPSGSAISGPGAPSSVFFSVSVARATSPSTTSPAVEDAHQVFLSHVLVAYIVIAYGSWLIANMATLRKRQISLGALAMLTLLTGPALMIANWIINGG